MNIKQKFATGLATAAFLGAVVAPMAFAADVTISGNGEGSHNTVTLSNSNTTSVSQSNVMSVSTTVNSSANTGGNQANENTGGDVTVTSGNASSTVGVSVTGGDNSATVTPCGCDPVNPSVSITGNGKDSKNKVKNTNSNTLSVGQAGVLSVGTTVGSKAKTGKNKANGNTGGGSVSVTSGGATSNVGVEVTGGSNTLN